jgi:hypothetical protein
MSNPVYIKEGSGLVFATTTTWSDIQKHQGWSIDKHFPDSKRILIDGRTGWFQVWYQWIDECLKTDKQWFIHIDEDCFIKNSAPILEHIRFMEINGYDISGCPDGYHEYRSGNHMALNSFFMIVNRRALESWKNWILNMEMSNIYHFPQFNRDWIEEYPYEKRNDSVYTDNQPWNVWVPNTEPYYNFMWVLKESGIKFHYMYPEYDPELSTTNLLDGSVIHAWYQRERWVDKIVSPIHKYNNKDRFDRIICTV